MIIFITTSYFNSTLVRLKLYIVFISIALPQEFQFHFGTIKTDMYQDDNVSAAIFQFHFGTIKTPYRLLYRRRYQYFNSTLVRLKRTGGVTHGPQLDNFNSTLVRLKPGWPTRIPRFTGNFNSTLVRLKRYKHGAYTGSHRIFQFHFGTIKT